MDESWRMKMGVPPAASARSTALQPEDFNDVFGGPPRSLLSRKFSADFSGNDWFYGEIFKPLDDQSDSSDVVLGRKLPEFMIPGKKRSKNKQVNKRMPRSKSTSSSIMSFDDELYQLNSFGSETVIGEDDVADLSSFTNKLRPINVPSRWTTITTSTTSMVPKTNNKRQVDLPPFECLNTTYINDINFIANDSNDYVLKGFNNFVHHQNVTSPRTINKEHTNFSIMPLNREYHLQVSPSSSPVASSSSSLCQGLEGRINNINYQENDVAYHQHVQVNDHGICSYENATNSPTMGVTSNNNASAIDIDEAIAWAKEKFQRWSLNGDEECVRENEKNFFAR